MKTALLILALAAATASNLLSEGITPKLVFLGEVEGKRYFADNGARNWNATRDFCQSMGMQLARVQTQNQLSFLRTAQNQTTFAGWYWTDGRDAMHPKQLVWDCTREDVPVDVVTEWFVSINVEIFPTCLMFRPDVNPSFQLVKCSHPTGLALCEN